MIDVPAFMTQDEIVHVPTVANLDQHHHVEQEVMPLSCITTLQGGGPGCVQRERSATLGTHAPVPTQEQDVQ